MIETGAEAPLIVRYPETGSAALEAPPVLDTTTID
jgi:hypothetical protein